MQTKPTVHINEHIKEQKFPKTFSFHSHTAEDLKAVEYVLPYASTHFTHPEENKVRPNKIVHGAAFSNCMLTQQGKEHLSVVDWTTVHLYVQCSEDSIFLLCFLYFI